MSLGPVLFRALERAVERAHSELLLLAQSTHFEVASIRLHILRRTSRTVMLVTIAGTAYLFHDRLDVETQLAAAAGEHQEPGRLRRKAPTVGTESALVDFSVMGQSETVDQECRESLQQRAQQHRLLA